MLCGSRTIFAMNFSGVVLKELKFKFLAWISVNIFRSLPCKCIQNVPAFVGGVVCVNVGL